MTLIPPSSDRNKIQFLNTLVATATAAASDNRSILLNKHVTQATDLQTSLLAKKQQVQDSFAQRRAAVAETNEKFAQLAELVRDFWAVLKRRARRQGSSNWFEQQFKHQTNPVDSNGNRAQILETAAELVHGENMAVAEGAEPMANPSAADLQAALSACQTAKAELDNIKEILADRIEQLDEDRKAVTLFYRYIARYFRYELGALASATRRDRMRRYGFQFSSNLAQSEGQDDVGDAETPSDGTETPTGETDAETGDPSDNGAPTDGQTGNGQPDSTPAGNAA